MVGIDHWFWRLIDWLIDWIEFYAESAIFQPCNGGLLWKRRLLIFVNVFSVFHYYPLMKKDGPIIWTNLNPHHPIDLWWFVPSLVKIGPVVLKKKIFYFVNVFSLFCYYLPLWNDVALYLNKLQSPSPKDALYQVWSKWAQWFWRNFLNFVNLFCNFVIISPYEMTWPFTWIPFTQECFVLSLIESSPVVLKKKTFKLRQCFFAISLLSPLKKGRDPSLVQNLEFSSRKNALFQVWS